MKYVQWETTSLVLGAAALLFVACKPANNGEAQQQTIENMSRTDLNQITLNSCGSETAAIADKEKLVKDIVASSDVEASAKEPLTIALRGAPYEMLKMFRADLKGKFVVASGQPAKCASSLSSAEKAFAGEGSNAAPIACWHAEDNAAPNIYIGSGKIANRSVSVAENARHNSIRMLAYVYAQHLPGKLRGHIASIEKDLTGNVTSSQRATLQELHGKFQDTLTRFVANKAALKAAFFADLNRLKSPATARLKTFATDAGERFDDFVLAEAFDSHYCSAKTRKSFAALTSGTAKAFAPFSKELGE